MENIFDKLCIPLNFQLINKEPGHISMHLAGVVFFSIFPICWVSGLPDDFRDQ